MGRTWVGAGGALLFAAALACSTTLRLPDPADGGDGAPPGEGGISGESGADGMPGEAGARPCPLPCASPPASLSGYTNVTGIAATTTALIVASASGITWCGEPACSKKTTFELVGTPVAIALAGVDTVAAVSSANKLYRCTSAPEICTELYVTTDLTGLTALSATPSKVFWINPTGSLLVGNFESTVSPAATWLQPNVAEIEIAAEPGGGVLLSVPFANRVEHVTGINITTTVASGGDVSQPRGLAVRSGDFYVASFGDGRVTRCPIAGCRDGSDASTSFTIAMGPGLPRRLTTDATHVYWTNEGSGTVARAPLAGGAVEVVMTGLTSPKYIAVNDAAIWVTVSTTNGKNDVVYVLK